MSHDSTKYGPSSTQNTALQPSAEHDETIIASLAALFSLAILIMIHSSFIVQAFQRFFYYCLYFNSTNTIIATKRTNVTTIDRFLLKV